MPADPFDLSDRTAYSVTRFYTRATNAHDHSRNVQVPMPSDIHAEIMRWVGIIPEYRSAQDVIRDAVRHRIQQLGEMDPAKVDHGLLAEYDLADSIEQTRHRVKLRRQLVRDAGDAAKEAVEAGDAAQMSALIAMYEGMVERLDDEVAAPLEKVLRGMRKQARMLRNGEL